MTKLITSELLRIVDQAPNWETAIRIAAESLLANHYINDAYVESMVQNVRDLGPYIVLAPNVAVPHARPDGNVNRMGISLTKFKQPVNFRNEQEDEDNWVSLIFCLAAVDASSHLVALQQLGSILESDEVIDQLITADKEDQLLSIINTKLEEDLDD